ncbi:formyltetrahydrofolate deformylase [Roseitalea porphyridii]|uniref:Formyltetrahydrofolate deformylase n=1 Tax=Roseitalea porphyridii TaxID=1852022 RepID=A0A4V1A492_9HYPH|nr:formyltetrahydrofolate deformylase [Roseitalea porphyridii]QBK31808.1 formyltetrahydrofolate deformylase [Roseitalea porphyridii]
MSIIITIACPDRIGIVAKLSGALSAHGYTILDSSQFYEPSPGARRESGEGRFFMRVECAQTADGDRAKDNARALETFLDEFAADFEARVTVSEKDRAVPAIIMVSKFDHCLQDIWYRVRTKSLPIDIRAIVSNHADSQADAERWGIPFHLLPVTPDNKAEQENRLEELVAETGAELIVMARYMQILSDGFSKRHFGRIINIHHSFLPAFKGAKPYHRAWDRGVKHIGATAHYVTPDLDEGPIIEQDTERVSHTSDPDDLVMRGRDIEARVLSRAIRLHAQGRVFINGSRTVVFQP